MNWKSRSVLATTSAVVLAGAGVMAIAQAVTPPAAPMPAPSATATMELLDPQAQGLAAQLQALLDQIGVLEAAVAASQQAPVVAASAPAPARAPAPAPAPAPATPATPATPAYDDAYDDDAYDDDDHEDDDHEDGDHEDGDDHEGGDDD